jgi:hypothetical protein
VAQVERADRERLSLGLLSPRRRVRGYRIDKLRNRHPQWFREDFLALLELLRRGEIHPLVSERLPLTEVRRAHELLESSAATGKLVLVPEGVLGGAVTSGQELAAEHGDAVLLVFATDRLARGDGRTAAHLVEYVLEGMKAGYRIEAVSEDLGGEMALVLASLYGQRAHADSRAKSVHTRAGKRRAAERGRRNGGPRPYGYRHVPRVVDGRATSTLEVVPENRPSFVACSRTTPAASLRRRSRES